MAASRQRERYSASASALLNLIRYALFLVGLLALGYVGYTLTDAQIYQAYEGWRLEHTANTETPKDGLRNLPEGSVIGRMEIPRIGLSTLVVQGDTEGILKRAAGHIPGTSLPGQSGNIALAGHRDSFFRPLRIIRPGDLILFETPGGTYDYEVEGTSVVAPTDLSVLRDTQQEQLTLITCYPFSWLGSAPNRFIVRARQLDIH
jgi:sortase A